MPGKCKFQNIWLNIELYKRWLLKEPRDIHSARCRVYLKSFKVDNMGELTLVSHSKSAGHKLAMKNSNSSKQFKISLTQCMVI